MNCAKTAENDDMTRFRARKSFCGRVRGDIGPYCGAKSPKTL